MYPQDLWREIFKLPPKRERRFSLRPSSSGRWICKRPSRIAQPPPIVSLTRQISEGARKRKNTMTIWTIHITIHIAKQFAPRRSIHKIYASTTLHVFGRNSGDLELQRSSSKEDTYNDHLQQCARICISVLNMKDDMKISTLFQGVVLRTKLQRERREPSSKANTYDIANIEAFEVWLRGYKIRTPFWARLKTYRASNWTCNAEIYP